MVDQITACRVASKVQRGDSIRFLTGGLAHVNKVREFGGDEIGFDCTVTICLHRDEVVNVYCDDAVAAAAESAVG